MDNIAIIGIGCRFPGAKTPDTFWQNLRSGVDGITEVSPERWDLDALYDPEAATPGKMNTRWGGFLEQVDRFEPSFFGISPREAQQMDPQQRLLLEVTWSALENAGIVPQSLAGSQTGVFIGLSNNADYSRLIYKDLSNLNAYSGTGTSNSIFANRLSYFFNLKGASMAIDTACSSSLVAVNLACQSLLSQDSNLCLVGGVNLILSPELTIFLSQARMMAADGRCKAFDSSADGYVRGEGCGVVVLKRLDNALKDGDNIQAVIKGSAVNQDGLTNGLIAPNGPSQQTVIRQALKKAGVKPAQISYVETQGTGTALGDTIEVNSLKKVLIEGREVDRPCWIGSVKTNIGHLEAAAGMAGLIKVVLSLQNQEIPANLHLKQLNPDIKLKNTPIQIPTELQPWSAGSEKRLAGVSSFGFGGTNAHLVLEEAPILESKLVDSDLGERSHHVLTLSAKCEKALKELVREYQTTLANDSTTALADICFTANTGRSHFKHRLAIVASDQQELADKLAKISAGEEPFGVFSAKLPSNNQTPKIALLFTRESSQHLALGRELYQRQPLFRETLEQCDLLLQPYLEKSILDVIYPKDGSRANFLERTAYTQPALFAIEYALFQLWQSWGVKPDVVMGHGIGEYVAATVAEVFSLEDGLKLIAHRGRLMQELPDDSIKPMLAELEAVANQITYHQPTIPIVSNLTGSIANQSIATASHWVNQIDQPVKLAQSMDTLNLEGYEIFWEIGANPILLGMGRECLSENEGVWLPSLRAGQSNWQQMLSSLAQLYVRGVKVNWSEFDNNYTRNKVSLPTYPFQGQRYWIETSEEKSHQAFVSAETKATRIVNCLDDGNTQYLAQQLEEAGKFSPEQSELLPELLEILVKQHQEQLATFFQPSSQNNFLAELKQASVSTLESKLSNYLLNCVAKVLGIETERIDLEQPLVSLGVDSLMAMEIRNQVQSDLEIDISLTKFMEDINLATLVIELYEQLTRINTQQNLISSKDSTILTDVYPLSYGQKALWFLWKLEPNSSTYNLSYSCRITEAINLTALQDAWQILCNRHPLLHSIFIQGETEPVQKPILSQKLDFEVVDASNLSNLELKQRINSESQRPFELQNKPAIRLRLFNFAAAEYVLLVVIHHIAVDGLSRGILVEEFQLIYQALLSDTKPKLTPLQNTYRDYVSWQRDLLAGRSGVKLWQYWQAKLGGDLPVLNLPTDKPRPPIQTYNGSSAQFRLSEQLTKDLKQLAKQEKVTLYTLVLAVYNVLLYRYTGQTDILVGTPTSGRTRAEFISVVGYFVDPVVMRANLSNNPSFSDFLAQLRQTVVEALAHQNFPFTLLVERLQPERELSHSPIFQTTFHLYNSRQFASLPASVVEEQTTRLKIEPWETRQPEALFDLDLEIKDDGTSLTGIFKYNTDLFGCW